jgi:uncharacterized protein (TIGR03435 family)
MKHLAKIFLILLATSGTRAASQTPAGPRMSFEVASIKAAPSGNTRRFITSSPNQFLATSYAVKGWIAYAYHVRGEQVLGVSGWMDSDGWDIQAKIKEGENPPRTGPVTAAILTEPDPPALMLQSLLEERFSLRVHREKRDLPVYELNVAKSGLRMKLNQDPPAETPRNLAEALGARGDKLPRGVSRQSRGLFEGNAIPMWRIVAALTNTVGRTVVDRTGLDGEYDFKLQWAPDFSIDPGSFGGVAPNPNQASPPSQFPEIFTALRERLGLQLVSSRAPLDVIVIDSVQKPSEN